MKWYVFLEKWKDANLSFWKEQLKQRNISKKNAIPFDKIYPTVHESGSISFVLSTGRCGTELLTRLLKMNNKTVIFHSPKPELLYHSKKAYEINVLGTKEEKKALLDVLDVARYELIQSTILNDKYYIETNNRISFFLPQLIELFPNAKFIYLHRSKDPFIQSGLKRAWYKDTFSVVNEGIITPVKGEEKNNWSSFTRSEKIEWLWQETNNFITERLPKENVLQITSEELFINPQTTIDVFRFLGLESPSLKKIKQRIAKPVNVGKN